MATTLAPQRRTPVSTWTRRSPLATLGDEFENLFGRMLGEESGAWRLAMMAPPLDVSETDKQITVRVDLPGIQRENVTIQLNHYQLTISGERQETKEEKGESFHRVERESGRFSRSITLTCAVDENKVEATYKDGVLTVTLPKSSEAQGHQIKIKS